MKIRTSLVAVPLLRPVLTSKYQHRCLVLHNTHVSRYGTYFPRQLTYNKAWHRPKVTSNRFMAQYLSTLRIFRSAAEPILASNSLDTERVTIQTGGFISKYLVSAISAMTYVTICAKRLAKCANLKINLSFLETGMGNLPSTF